jgi:hypothetical protein
MITKCNKLTSNSIISVAENNRNFRIINASLFSVNEVAVDGCYITFGLRCDYLFEIINNEIIEKIFYVELKGSDIHHAILQLEETLLNCTTIHNNIKKECYIIASKFPKAGTASQVMKKKFLTKNRIQLFIDTKVKEVKI